MEDAGADPEKFIAAAFTGIFETQRNLADEADIAAILSETGYEPHWLKRGKSAQAEALYQANLEQALAEGVFGSPSYLLDGEIFWGQDRLDLLDDALASRARSSRTPEFRQKTRLPEQRLAKPKMTQCHILMIFRRFAPENPTCPDKGASTSKGPAWTERLGFVVSKRILVTGARRIHRLGGRAADHPRDAASRCSCSTS